ncbi:MULTISPECIES: hypothetical protein [unclassified Pseudomonas]|uniref:hypothetical protein n=1 Tax=unclassified Pseudomonas TaxID=196821 RepID=UPI001268BA5A|nr:MULTISPECIES: hypothetical protein [unclassified Pseudomonas]
MKLTFVLREDLLELCAAAACIYSAYFAWRLEEPLGLAFALLFGAGGAYFYLKKNRARWCARCNRLMTYGTEPAQSSSDFEVTYTCPQCGRKNKAGIETENPSQ